MSKGRFGLQQTVFCWRDWPVSGSMHIFICWMDRRRHYVVNYWLCWA